MDCRILFLVFLGKEVVASGTLERPQDHARNGDDAPDHGHGKVADDFAVNHGLVEKHADNEHEETDGSEQGVPGVVGHMDAMVVERFLL